MKRKSRRLRGFEKQRRYAEKAMRELDNRLSDVQDLVHELGYHSEQSILTVGGRPYKKNRLLRIQGDWCREGLIN